MALIHITIYTCYLCKMLVHGQILRELVCHHSLVICEAIDLDMDVSLLSELLTLSILQNL